MQLCSAEQESWAQQRWPASPHAVQTSLPPQSVHGAVQPTSPPQQDCPSLPQLPAWHPPLIHRPCPDEQLLPAATHVGPRF